MLVLIFLPTGYEGALSYQNADRVPALVLSTDESDIYDTGLVRSGDQRCRVRILGGQFAGTETDAVNRLNGSLAQDKLFAAGDKAACRVYGKENKDKQSGNSHDNLFVFLEPV